MHKKGSEYIFSMKPDRTAKQVVIKRNTYPNFLYIPVKQIISEEGDVSIYRKGERLHCEAGERKGDPAEKKNKHKIYIGTAYQYQWDHTSQGRPEPSICDWNPEDAYCIRKRKKLYAEVAPCASEEKIPDLKQAASPVWRMGVFGTSGRVYI